MSIYRKKASVVIACLASAVIMIPSQVMSVTLNYKDALKKSVYFYGAQRSGNAKSWIHGSCYINDGKDVGVNLSGGWHDCGDHVKFGQTNAYSADLLLHAYLRFPKAFADNYDKDDNPSSDGIPDVLNEVKVFTDYLMKTIDGNTVYYQVGDANTDHNSVGTPEFTDDLSKSLGGEPRNVYSVTGGGATNYCGAAAAALAMMSMAYESYDASYASQCLTKAKEFYAFGDSKHESVSSQNPTDTYDGGEWADDLALGAFELYLATGDLTYKDAAKTLFNDYINEKILPTGFVMEYSNSSPILAYELYKKLGSPAYLSRLSEEVSQYYSKMTSDGFAFFAQWGNFKYSSAAAYVCFLYDDLKKENGGAGDQTAFEFAKKNIDFILGDHGNVATDAPANFSFLVGFDQLGGGYPTHVHHNSAFGYDDGGDFSRFNSSTPNKNTLTGAIVGGPIKADGSYEDTRAGTFGADGNEPCIYYNAPFVGALAYLVLNSDSSTDTTVPPDTNYVNQLAVAGWEMTDDGEFGTISSMDSSHIHDSNGYISADMTIPAENDSKNIYPWAQLTAYLDTNLVGVTDVILKYKSDNTFRVVLDQIGLDTMGASYEYSLLASADWKEVTIPVSSFAQPSWIGSSDPEKGDYDASKVTSVSFAGNASTSVSIQIQVLGLKGYIGNTSGIISNVTVASNSGLSLKNLTNREISLEVPVKADYSIDIYSLSGKKITSLNKSLGRGLKNVSLGATPLAKGLYFIKISSENETASFRTILK